MWEEGIWCQILGLAPEATNQIVFIGVMQKQKQILNYKASTLPQAQGFSDMCHTRPFPPERARSGNSWASKSAKTLLTSKMIYHRGASLSEHALLI